MNINILFIDAAERETISVSHNYLAGVFCLVLMRARGPMVLKTQLHNNYNVSITFYWEKVLSHLSFGLQANCVGE